MIPAPVAPARPARVEATALATELQVLVQDTSARLSPFQPVDRWEPVGGRAAGGAGGV